MLSMDIGDASVHLHYSAVQYRAADPENFAAYYKFAFLRHPLDRLVSAFAYYTNSSRHASHIAFAQRHFADLPDFPSFLKALADPWFRARLFTATHFRPQVEFVADHRGAILVDELYRFDEMEAGVAALSYRFSDAGTLVKRNASQRQADWREYYDAAGKRLAERIYAADFEIYENIRTVRPSPIVRQAAIAASGWQAGLAGEAIPA